MNFLKKLNSRRLKMSAFSALTILTLSLGQFFVTTSAQAADPQFNTFTPFVHTQTYNRDYYLLDVKNETQGTDWGFPVSANAGDLLTFYVYYHNTTNNSTATNTTLKVALPSTAATSQSVTASLWADNATNATLASPMTQSVTANLTSSQTLQYVSGSAKWYPNQADWRTATATAFPSGQTGDQLFASGVNVGSVQGCWEYSSAIVFQARVGSTVAGTPSLSIAKTVLNVTDGQSSYSESVNAEASEYVKWQIKVQNTGTATATNVKVYDTLPSYMSYVSGSTLVDGVYDSTNITNTNINLGSLTSGTTKTITFQAQMNSSLTASQTLTNYGYAYADSISQVSDTASVYTQGTTLAVIIASNLSKQVSNLTTPNGTNTDNTASVGDTLKYTLSYTNNTGVALTNAQILDVLPSYTTYYSVDSSGSYSTATNMLTWNYVSIPAGSTVTVSHQVKVLNVPSDDYLIANTAAIKADNLSLINSNETRTTVNAPVVKGVSITAVTGGDNVARNFAASLMVSLWGIFFLYLIMENKEFWQNSKVKWAILKIRMKER